MSEQSLPPLPDGTVCYLMHSGSADSPVGGLRGVVRKLRYEVREGREADEASVLNLFCQVLIADRNSSFILLEVGDGDQCHDLSD